MSKRSIILSLGFAGFSIFLLLATAIFNFGPADELVHTGCQKFTCAYMNIKVPNRCRIVLNGMIQCTVHKPCPSNRTTLATCYDNHHKFGAMGFCPRDNICTQIKTEKIVFISTIVVITFATSILIASLAWFVKDYFFSLERKYVAVDWQKRGAYEPINDPITV